MFDPSIAFYHKKKRTPICYLDGDSRFQSFFYSNGLEHRYNFKRHPTFKNVGAGGIIIDSLQRILVVKGSIKWSLPKGHLNAGEKYHQCAMREIFEETGLVVNLTPTDRYIDIKKCLYYFIHYPGIGPSDLKTNDSNEISEIQWLTIDQIKLLPCNRQLEYLISRWEYILNTFQKSKITIELNHQNETHPCFLKIDSSEPNYSELLIESDQIEPKCNELHLLEDQLTLPLLGQ